MNLPFLDLLTAFGQSLLFAFIGVLPILNPLATAPLFVDQARGLSDQGRVMLAHRIGKNVAILLAVTMLTRVVSCCGFLVFLCPRCALPGGDRGPRLPGACSMPSRPPPTMPHKWPRP